MASYFSYLGNDVLQRHDRMTALQTLREELLRGLQTFVHMAADEPLPDRCALEASALLRLYCALKVIEGRKTFISGINR